jgi:hypothetical protein
MTCSKSTPITKYTLKYIAGTGGTISGSTTQTVEKGKSGSQVTAVPNSGYTFSKWSDGKTSASRTDTNVQRDITVTAKFVAQTYYYTLKYIAGTGGTISGSTTQTVEKGKSGSQVTAVPNSGYTFSKWSDGKTSASRTDTNVQNDITVTAEFVAQTYYYTLKYIAGTGGTISGSTTQEVEKGKSGSQVTAVPSTGYRFSKWSDGKTSASRTDTNVQGDITVTAEFVVQTYTVTYDANGGTCIPSSRTVEYGGVSGAPTCTKAGYYIAGFSRTQGSGGNLNTKTGVVTNVSGDQTVQVNWSESCGDGICAEDENAQNCPADCDAVCGDSYCTHDENASTCPEDCVASCGDGYCTHNETNETCPADCPADCGDGYCDPETETAANCPADCDAVCGDGYCTHNETNETCPVDCPADCGDGYCDPETETAANCPADCGAVCGDGFCTHDETSVNCPEDCGPVSSGEVPSTGIFDNSQNALLAGFGLLILGFTWRILGRGVYISIEFLGKVPKKISIQMRDIKEDIRAKKRIKEMKIADKRKKNFERKVVKD